MEPIAWVLSDCPKKKTGRDKHSSLIYPDPLKGEGKLTSLISADFCRISAGKLG